MQQIITNTQIFDVIPGCDFEIKRQYDLDENVSITSAILAIKTIINTPYGTVTGPGTIIPIYMTINDTQSVNGIISDSGQTSGICELTFLLSGLLTGNCLDSYTMYFFGVKLITSDSTPQQYQPESGTITTGQRMIP